MPKPLKMYQGQRSINLSTHSLTHSLARNLKESPVPICQHLAFRQPMDQQGRELPRNFSVSQMSLENILPQEIIPYTCENNEGYLMNPPGLTESGSVALDPCIIICSTALILTAPSWTTLVPKHSRRYSSSFGLIKEIFAGDQSDIWTC